MVALASSSDPGLRRVIPVEFIEHPSIGPPFIINLINSQDDDINDVDLHPEENVEQAVYGFDKPWLEAIRAYIADGTLPSEKWAAGKVKAQAAQYVLVVGEIYKWRFSRPLMTCVEKDKAQKFMDEIHAGSCRNHSGRRSLAIKVKRHGYYWPTMIKDCERFTKMREMPKACTNNPSACRGPLIDFISLPVYALVDGYHRSLTQVKTKKIFLSVLTDFFSKWVDAKSYASIKDAQVKSFVWRNIICRHGVPYEIIMDNGSQFISTIFEAFCKKWKIRLTKLTPRYPQGNGQAETINKTILDGLKKRLDAKKGRCPKSSKESFGPVGRLQDRQPVKPPFALVYGTKCMISAEVEFPGVWRRLLHQQEDQNNLMLLHDLDLINEHRDQAFIQIQNYQEATAKYYNSHIRNRRFHEGDLVLRKVFQNTDE